MVCHSLLQRTTFCQTSPPWLDHLGWPHTAWLSFSELDKAVVLWSDWLVFCDYGFSASALWCPLTTPSILLGFLLSWTWGISSWLLQQSAAAAPYLGWGVSSHSFPSWLECGVAPLSLQSYKIQNSVVLAQKQAHRSMEHNREPRNKPILIWTIDLWQRCKNTKWRNDSLFNKWW